MQSAIVINLIITNSRCLGDAVRIQTRPRADGRWWTTLSPALASFTACLRRRPSLWRRRSSCSLAVPTTLPRLPSPSGISADAIRRRAITRIGGIASSPAFSPTPALPRSRRRPEAIGRPAEERRRPRRRPYFRRLFRGADPDLPASRRRRPAPEPASSTPGLREPLLNRRLLLCLLCRHPPESRVQSVSTIKRKSRATIAIWCRPTADTSSATPASRTRSSSRKSVPLAGKSWGRRVFTRCICDGRTWIYTFMYTFCSLDAFFGFEEGLYTPMHFTILYTLTTKSCNRTCVRDIGK